MSEGALSFDRTKPYTVSNWVRPAGGGDITLIHRSTECDGEHISTEFDRNDLNARVLDNTYEILQSIHQDGWGGELDWPLTKGWDHDPAAP